MNGDNPVVLQLLRQLTGVQIQQVPHFTPEGVYLGITVTITGFRPDPGGEIAIDAIEQYAEALDSAAAPANP